RLAGVHALAKHAPRQPESAGAPLPVRSNAHPDGARQLQARLGLGVRGPLPPGLGQPYDAERLRRKLAVLRSFPDERALQRALRLGPSFAAGCGLAFDGPSKVQGLRVLAVVADKPYALPGDEVTFTLTYVDAYSETNPDVGARNNIQVLWLGGCIDPEGDYYY